MRESAGSLLLLFGVAAVSVAAVLIPSAMTSPFVFHTPDLVERLYTLSAWAPTLTVLLAIAGAWLTFRIWRADSPKAARAIALVPMLALVGAVFFSRQHIVEWAMFAPIEEVDFVAQAAAGHVADDDLVLAVTVGERARAYPVLMTAYYHIVNDELDGEPYAVTY